MTKNTPRCVNCKERFEKKDFRNKYCPKKECQEVRKEQIIEKQTKKAMRNLEKIQKQEEKEWKERKKSTKIDLDSSKNRDRLNKACQKLARMIDVKCGNNTCIDCKLPFKEGSKRFDGADRDGGHVHSKGSNSSLAWNLHNIWSQKANCNSNGKGGGKQTQVYEGLLERFGQEYHDFVRYDIVRMYPRLGMNNLEVYEKLALVRKIIREFDKYDFTDPIEARKQLNIEIGIYNE